MEGILDFVSIVIIIFGILQIILFFKLWGMTNNISEMKNMMELFMRKDSQNTNNTKENKSSTCDISDNVEYDKEDFPMKSKFAKGDIVLYKTENIRLIVIGYLSPNIFKCQTVDGSKKTYCFKEDYLDKCEN